jgi:hypothetical protein
MAESLVNVNDQDLRNGFTKGWFISRIQDALQELAFDTFYQEFTVDDTLPANLRLAMPKNMFNVKRIYLFNESCCNTGDSQVVHWKRTFDNKGSADSYTSRVTSGFPQRSISEPFLPKHRGADRAYYANVQNGIIMFSSSCSNYTKVRIVYNGMGVEIGDEPIIPRFFERYVNDYVEERYYSAMKAREPRKYRTLWTDAYSKLEASHMKAKMRISSMNTFEKESLEEYIGNIYAK